MRAIEKNDILESELQDKNILSHKNNQFSET